MLFRDTPARIDNPGTWPFASAVSAHYTVGADFVQPAMAKILARTTELSVDIETYGLGLLSRRIKSVSFGNDYHSVVFDPRDPYQEDLIRKTFRQATRDAVAPMVVAQDWIPLQDGKTLAGWKAAERPESWVVEDGAFVSRGDRVAFFDMPRLDISSSLLRRRAAAGGPLRYLVPDAVAEYITRERLYTAAQPAPSAER